MLIKTMNTIITVLAGIGAALVLYWVINKLAELLPGQWEDRLKPYVSSCPAFAAITLYLLYPAVQTIIYSFANAASTEWVGLRQLHQPADEPRLPADADQHRCCGS